MNDIVIYTDHSLKIQFTGIASIILLQCHLSGGGVCYAEFEQMFLKIDVLQKGKRGKCKDQIVMVRHLYPRQLIFILFIWLSGRGLRTLVMGSHLNSQPSNSLTNELPLKQLGLNQWQGTQDINIVPKAHYIS